MNQILLLCEDTSVAQNQNKPKRNRWESDEVTNNYTPPIETPSWCILHYYDPFDDPSGASDSGSGSGSSFPGISPDTSPGIAPNTNPGISSYTNSGEAPNTNLGYDPDTNTGYDPNTNIENNPDTNISIVSDPRPGFVLTQTLDVLLIKISVKMPQIQILAIPLLKCLVVLLLQHLVMFY